MNSLNKEQKQKYQKYIKEVTPTHSLPLEMGKAFLTGGLICVLGQFLINTGLSMGLEEEAAGTWCSILLVLLSVLLSGFNLYPSIAKWGGARRSRSHHRVCQRRCLSRHRIQEGRTGLRNRFQDLHHRRSRYSLRCCHLLDSGTDLLVILVTLPSFCYIYVRELQCPQTLSYRRHYAVTDSGRNLKHRRSDGSVPFSF